MKNFKIIYTSDTHGYLLPTDYTERSHKPMGLLAMMNHINPAPNQWIIDGGDTIQGSPFATYLGNNHTFEPIAKTMNAVGYDYVALGNHDFNYGYQGLQSYLSTLDAKVLAANIECSDHNDFELLPYDKQTLENGLKVGIIGISTDHINVWEKKSHLEKFKIDAPFTAAKHFHDKIRNEVDLLIGLYHGGFENDINTLEPLTTSTENIGYRLCNELAFDLLLTGHQHMPIINQELHNTHIVQPPANLTSYVEIDITYGDQVEITSQLVQPSISESELVDMINRIDAPINAIEKEVQIWLDESIGFLNEPIQPKSHIEMALKGTQLTDFVNHIQLSATGADISCTSLANQVKGLPKEVTRRDVVSTYVYPNTLFVLEVNGSIIKSALERCAEYFETNDQGEIVVSEIFTKPKIEHYNYDFFAGIEYTLDLSKALGKRVVSISKDGKPIQDDDTLSLVMNNYRATGTGGYAFYSDCKVLHEDQTSTQDMVAKYIESNHNLQIPSYHGLKIIGL